MPATTPSMLGSPSAPGSRHFAVTPHDTNLLTFKPRALYVGVQGDLVLEDDNGVSCTYVGVSGILPFMPSKVKATGTTAASVVAIY